MELFNVVTLAEEVQETLRDLVAEPLSAGQASLVVERFSSGSAAGTQISLVPKRRDAAEIKIICEDGIDLIYMHVGRETALEVPLEGQRYTNLSNKEEFIAIVRAVVNGSFDEEVWIGNSGILRTEGRISIDPETVIRVRNVHKILRYFFTPSEKYSYHYVPYSEA